MIGLEIFNTFILLLLVVAAVTSLWVKDLLVSAAVFGVYSFLMCLLWAEMGAVDVAFTEATVGAGISTVVLVATIFHLRRISND
jgi:energy-converting hydrogenase B subunit D